jgi:hypothetical protein
MIADTLVVKTPRRNQESLPGVEPVPAALPDTLPQHPTSAAAQGNVEDGGVPLLLHRLLPGALLLVSGFIVVWILVNANYDLPVQGAIIYLIALATMVGAAGWILFGPTGFVNVEGHLRVGLGLSAAWSLAVVVFLILDQVFLESRFYPAQAVAAIIFPWLLGWSCFGLYLWAVRKS